MAVAPHCETYLIVEAGSGAQARLAAALGAAAISSVLIAAPAGAALVAADAKPLIDLAHNRGIAALVFGDARLARTLRADGVHVPAGPDLLLRYAEAREIVGKGAVVGVDAGGSRHDAMEAGEAGADYVAFGLIGSVPPMLDDNGVALDDVLDLPGTRDDLLAWWSEIFEVPSVAFNVTGADDAEVAAQCGADFVAVRLDNGMSAPDAADLVMATAAAVARSVS